MKKLQEVFDFNNIEEHDNLNNDIIDNAKEDLTQFVINKLSEYSNGKWLLDINDMLQDELFKLEIIKLPNKTTWAYILMSKELTNAFYNKVCFDRKNFKEYASSKFWHLYKFDIKEIPYKIGADKLLDKAVKIENIPEYEFYGCGYYPSPYYTQAIMSNDEKLIAMIANANYTEQTGYHISFRPIFLRIE